MSKTIVHRMVILAGKIGGRVVRIHLVVNHRLFGLSLASYFASLGDHQFDYDALCLCALSNFFDTFLRLGRLFFYCGLVASLKTPLFGMIAKVALKCKFVTAIRTLILLLAMNLLEVLGQVSETIVEFAAFVVGAVNACCRFLSCSVSSGLKRKVAGFVQLIMCFNGVHSQRTFV